MPLSIAVDRKEIHHRVIDMKAYARDDGWFDVEARLVDRKPFPTLIPGFPNAVPAGVERHDLWVRLTLDNKYVVREIEAASDVTPYAVCKEATSTLSSIVGLQIASGWSLKVKDLLRGSKSCTHLMEMLIPMATTALQGIGGLNADERRAAVAANGIPYKIDSCYAYSSSSEVTRVMWPQHFRSRSSGT